MLRIVLLMLILSVSGPARDGPATSGGHPEKEPGTSTKPVELSRLPASVYESKLRALRGRPIKLSSYSGKVLVLNLWATWCSPCRVETPELVILQKKFRSQGVEILGLSTENPDSSARQVRQWVRQFGVPYRIGWAPPEFVETLVQERHVLPQTFVISRDGRIVKHLIGFNPMHTTPQLSLAIVEALNAETTRPPAAPVVVKPSLFR